MAKRVRLLVLGVCSSNLVGSVIRFEDLIRLEKLKSACSYFYEIDLIRFVSSNQIMINLRFFFKITVFFILYIYPMHIYD